MLEEPKIKKVDKRDKQLPQNFEQLIEMYDVEKIWPYMKKVIDYINNNLGSNNVEEIAVKQTQPTNNEKVWFQKSKNLLDLSEFTDVPSSYGVSFKLINNNIVVNGTAEDYASSNVYFYNLEDGETYTISANVANVQVYVQAEGETTEGELTVKTLARLNSSNGSSCTFTHSKDTNYNRIKLLFYVTSGIVYNNYPLNLQIEKGNTATGYKPYGIEDKKIYTKREDGEYEVFMENEVVVSPTQPTTNEKVWIQYSKNRINPNNKHNTSASYDFTNDTYKLTSAGSIYLLCKLVVGKTYTLSYKNNNGFVSIRASDYNNGGSWLEYGRSTTTDGTITFTATTDTVVVQFINGTANSSTVQKVQLEEGSNETEYKSYTEKAIYVKNDNGVYEEILDVEKVNAQQNYSTEEQVIGTWIDGKLLYRKVVEISSIDANANSVDASISIPNLNEITNIGGTLKTSFGAYKPLNTVYCDGSNIVNHYTFQVYAITGSMLTLVYGDFWKTNFGKLSTILEYTKTTD